MGNYCKVTQKILFALALTFKVKFELNKNHEIERQNLYNNDYKPLLNTSVSPQNLSVSLYNSHVVK